MKYITLLVSITLLFISCKQKTSTTEVEAPESVEEIKKDTELVTLFGMMQGSYNSATQAAEDSSYYNISLHMYPIWKDKGNFLYVEQALNSMQDKPYRQRIYEVKRVDEETIASYIYTIPNDSLWIGKWKTPEAFDSVSPSDIVLRNGCEVLLKQQEDGTFMGRTGEKTCESSLRGASYATSEVAIDKGLIVSWDRGFDTEGNHIWGAEKGGYVFEIVE